MAYKSPKERYLEASKGWAPVHIGKDWVGTKHLGGGVYGIATLFEYRGDNPDVSPRKIVVKQEGGKGWNLKQESRMLQKLMKFGSEHIIKLYRAYHRTMGTGTSPDMDGYIVDYNPLMHKTEQDHECYIETQLGQPQLHDIARIYLECASQGDLNNWMVHNCDDTQPSEEYVFRLWECLLRGLMVLKHGTEEWDDDLIQQGSTFHNPIVHLDLKGHNILIGENPKPGHGRIRAHKLADFGFALEVPDGDELKRDSAKKREWIKLAQGRNTFHAPEQFYRDHPNRDIGTRTDLWNIAHVIYQAILSLEFVPINVIFRTAVDPDPSRSIRTLEFWRRVGFISGGGSGGYDGWEGKYPEPSQRRSGDPEMQVEKLVKRRFPKLPALKNPLGWSFEEDEYDYDDVQLLFPTRKAVRMGYREMPFELGEAEMQSLFLDGRVVGKSGKPVRDRDEIADSAEEPERDEEEEEEREQREADKDKTSKEEDRTSSSNKTTIIISSSRTTSAPSKGKATPKPLRGVKRMRSASEERKRPSPRFSPNSSQVARFGRISQRFLPRSQSAPQSQSEAQSSPHTLSSSQAPRKKQRRHSPTSPNMEQEPREYIRSAGGELYSLPMRSTPGDDGDDQDSVEERSAPWVGYDDDDDDDDDESTV